MTTHFILGYKSRFDIANGKFCGPAADLLSELLPSEPISTSYVGEPLPPASAYIFAGPKAWAAAGRTERDIGVVFGYNNRPAICTYHPQDACDVRNVEADFQGLDDDDGADDDGDGKDSAQTQRANYRFWLAAHLHKLRQPLPPAEPFNMIGTPLNPLGFPPSEYLYLDIESHPPSDTVQCLSVAFDRGPVYACQIYDHRGQLTPWGLRSMVWLARAMRRYCTVVHNALFDLPFLAMFHSVPWGERVHDTMLMWHRLFPEADKSLAHLIQYFTNEPYHKDSAGTFTPRNADQASKLLLYNARDVHTLRMIHRALLAHETPSMRQVNESIPVYLYAGLEGFTLNLPRLLAHQRTLEAKLTQLTRIFRILVGSDINPNSGQQIAEWLFTGLRYKPHDTTDTGAPKTDATELYKQLIKHEDNAALITLLHIKGIAKQLSMLKFEPWTQPHKR